MNIINSVIIVLLISGALYGLRNGALKLSVSLVGTLIVIILAFSLRHLVAEVMYRYLPFFNFGGVFKGLQVLNILLYETIAFLIMCTIFGIVLKILLKITGVIEKIFSATIVLGLVSKLAGAVLGMVEVYILIFVLLYFFKQPFINISGVNDSYLANVILTKTPVLTSKIEKTNDSIEEIYALKDDYLEIEDKDEFNKKVLDKFLENDIVTVDSVILLKNKNKLNFNGLDSLIEKYGG